MRINRAGREADHSPLPITDMNNEWSYTSTSPYTFMPCVKVILFVPEYE